MQQPPWMAAAWAELGQAELAGITANPRILDYFRRIGQPATSDETAWCAAFVGACLECAGLQSTRSLRARSYLTWGEAESAPAPGAIVVLSRGTDPSLGHVGFLLGMTSSRVIVLGGNQTNAVTVAAYDRARLIACRKPSAAAAARSDHDRRAFETALAHVLAMEGGWSDDPFDSGGPTNKGITLADLAREKQIEVTADSYAALKAELRHIPDTLVRDIYLTRYWRPASCPDLPVGLALMHFDAAVNQGVAGAARMLQEALGVAVDGEIGPVTLGAASSRPVAASLQAYAAIRRRRYRALSSFWRFGRGWLARVDSTLAAALQAAPPSTSRPSTSKQETKPMSDGQANFSTTPESDTGTDASSTDAKWWGQSMTIWGALLTALSTVLPLLGPALGIDITADLVQQLGQNVVVFVQAAGGLIGTVLTILGRVRATSQLQRRPLSLKL